MISIIGANFRTMVIPFERFNMSEMGTIIVIITSRETTMVAGMNRVTHIPPPPQKKWEGAPMDSGGSMTRVEDMQQKMMRRFQAIDENVMERRSDISRI